MAISKEDILTTGIEIFSEKGYQDTSVQDIAERCGMSKASFYSFFPSKEDIFIAVFMELQDHFKSNIAMLSNIQLEPRVQFQHACSLLIELFSQNCRILRSSSTPEPPIINARKAEFGRMDSPYVQEYDRRDIRSGIRGLCVGYDDPPARNSEGVLEPVGKRKSGWIYRQSGCRIYLRRPRLPRGGYGKAENWTRSLPRLLRRHISTFLWGKTLISCTMWKTLKKMSEAHWRI